MAVFIDGQPVDLSGRDLGSVLDQVREQLVADGRVVVEVELDGRRLDSQELAGQRRHQVDQSRLCLTTADSHVLAVTALRQVRLAMAAGRDEQVQTAEQLQQDQQSQALKGFESVVSTWQRTQQALVAAVQMVQMDLAGLLVDGQSAEVLLRRLADQLKVTCDLVAARDTVGLADVLLYEWPQVIDQWDRLLGTVIDAIARSGSGRDDRG